MKSESEEFCKDSFDTYLRKVALIFSPHWEEVQQEAEPPDFFLSINSTRYAVEATMLIHKLDVETKNHLPLRTIGDFLDKFIKNEIEQVVRSNGYLRGAYTVVFPKPIGNFNKVKGAIQRELLSYISNTQAVTKCAPRTVYKEGRQECRIEKSHDKADKVVTSRPVISKWEGEALDEAKQLLNDRVDEKGRRLLNISNPKILLLHNKYLFADSETYKTCISDVPSRHFFHTIFVAESNYDGGKILYSMEPTWT
jgi:hypothetical protein